MYRKTGDRDSIIMQFRPSMLKFYPNFQAEDSVQSLNLSLDQDSYTGQLFSGKMMTPGVLLMDFSVMTEHSSEYVRSFLRILR